MISDIETGSVTRFAYGNPCTILDIVQADSQKIRDFLPDVLHIFSCAARRTFWNSDTETIKELQPFNPSLRHPVFLPTVNSCVPMAV